MKKTYASLLSILTIFLFITSSLTSVGYNIEKVKKERNEILSSADITIPDDYQTIQEAVNNANKGETILVRSGVYKENIVVDVEGLSIIGENKFNTIIDADKKSRDGMNISAPNVTIQGFTFTNALSEEIIWDLSGLRIYSENITVDGNRFENNVLGLTVMASCYNSTITNNSFIGDGIFLGQYQKIHILKEQDFYHKIENNSVNGRPLYYFSDSKDFEVPVDGGQYIIVNCSNVTVKDLYISNTDFSVILAYCDNCTIENITVMNTNGEVILFNSDYNIVQNNIMIENLHGACLDYFSDYNIIRNNYASDNLIGLSAVTSCSYNVFVNNTVENNILSGIHISTFCVEDQHHNQIINNTVINSEKYGISLGLNSYNNTIESNIIKKCGIGIFLNKSPNNLIQKNTINGNEIQALNLNSNKNTWNQNYWNRPRVLPKIVLGIPYINIDWHPAKQPY